MDPSAFDSLARTDAQPGTRRRLLRLLAALLLGSRLLTASEAAAERPIDRLRGRQAQRRRKRRNQHHQNNQSNSNNGGNSGGGGRNPSSSPPPGIAGPCTPTDSACSQSSQCCTGNCFIFVCSEPVSQCAGQPCPSQTATATGCCGGTCCFSPANQCNLAGLCCAPNCTGRPCGPDGCGRGGTCGSCPPCQACDEVSGQCLPRPNGTPCGTQSEPGGGTTRCCNGTCPDPSCLGARQVCLDEENCEVSCCTQLPQGTCPGTTCVCGSNGPGGLCGSDSDCNGGSNRCVCGQCCAAQGQGTTVCPGNPSL